jgi:hypothetical protein
MPRPAKVLTASRRVRQQAGRWLVLTGILMLAAPALAAQVEIPDTTASYDSSILLPVRVAGLTGENVVATEVTVVFDPNAVQLGVVDVAGTAAETWLLDTLRVPGPGLDTLKIAAATAAAAMTADGILFNLAVTTSPGRHPASIPFELFYVLLNAGVPTAVAVDGSVTIVGSDAVVDITPPSITLGEPLSLSVVDADADTTVGTDEVTLKVTSGIDTENVQAVEVSPGQFETTLATVFSVGGTAEDGLLQATAGDQISLCFTDSLDATGSTVERCASASVIVGLDGTLDATVALQPGDLLRARVTDGNLNANPAAVDVATATVINDRTGEQEPVALTETGINTATFFGSLATVSGAGPGADDDGQMEARAADILRVEYVDAATALGGAEVRVWPTTTLELFGDCSGNGTIRGFDASLILNHSVGVLTLTGLDSLAANLDLGAPYTKINAFDASLVLQQRVGLITSFPVRSKDSANHPQPESAAAPRIAVPAVAVYLVPIAEGWALRAESATPIHSGDVVLRGFRGQALAGEGLGGGLVASHTDGAVSRVSFATSADASGDLLRLVPASPNQTPVLESLELNGGGILALLLDEPVTSARPGRFQLHPAWPNPFNPGTTISFELTADSQTRLWIINALGQRVRVLLNGHVTAGRHTLPWDGRDDAGRAVGAGVYFYRLQTPTHGALGKMTLAK